MASVPTAVGTFVGRWGAGGPPIAYPSPLAKTAPPAQIVRVGVVMLRSVKDYEDEGKLSTAEAMLIDAVRAGQDCTLSDTRPDTATDANTIRAELLAVLITGGLEGDNLHRVGVALRGGYITGALTLTHGSAVGDTFLVYCHFDSAPEMRGAKFTALELVGSHLPALNAQRIEVAQDLFLSGAKVVGTTNLSSAKIGGQLDCEEAELAAPKSDALNAQGIEVAQDLLLSGAKVTGQVNLSGAKIGGQLDCEGAEFTAPEGDALNAQGIAVGQDVFLSWARVMGTTRLSGAKIGGQLVCEEAVFTAPEGDALNAQGIEVAQDLFLRGAKVTGTTHLSGAKIGGFFDCEGGELTAPEGDALNAQGIEAQQSLFLRGAKVTGTIDLNSSKIGGQLDCEGAHLTTRGGTALNLQRATVGEALLWQDVTVVSGDVSLAAATVGDLWDDVKSWPRAQNPKQPNLQPQLHLDGFTYTRLFATTTRAKDRLPWLAAGSYSGGAFTPQPYTQLAKVLREMGHMGEARQVLFERQKLLAAAQYWAGYRKGNGKYLFPLEKPLKDLQFLGRWGFDLLLRWVVGYGYRPLNAVMCLAFLFLTATALANVVWEEGSFAPNSDVILVSDGWQRALAMDCLPEIYPCDPNPAATWSNDPQRGLDWDSFNRYGYAADLVIPVLNLGQTDAWAPSKDRGPWGLALWWGRWVLIAAGWIVTALGVAAMTGVMQRNKED